MEELSPGFLRQKVKGLLCLPQEHQIGKGALQLFFLSFPKAPREMFLNDSTLLHQGFNVASSP